MTHATATLNGQASDVWNTYWKFGALATGTPTNAVAGTEITGGSPAYARKATVAGSSSAGSNVASAITFDVPASSPANFEGFTLVSAGVYSGWVGFTAIVFGVQGQLIVTPTATQT